MKKQKQNEIPKSDVPNAEIKNDTIIETNEVEKEFNVEEIKQLNEKYAELTDKNLRLMAEFDNYRKRTLKEKMDLISTAGEKILIDILPFADDFDRAVKAMENSDDIEAIKEGVLLIQNKLLNFLQANGVKEIPTENETFNVDIHEAVTTFPAQTEEDKGKIIDCVSKGYMLNEKVIRFPKVVVGE